jgi:hypothetical protein
MDAGTDEVPTGRHVIAPLDARAPCIRFGKSDFSGSAISNFGMSFFRSGLLRRLCRPRGHQKTILCGERNFLRHPRLNFFGVFTD